MLGPHVVCQDCLHTDLFTAAKHDGDEQCSVCNGDFCGCESCNAEIAQDAANND